LEFYEDRNDVMRAHQIGGAEGIEALLDFWKTTIVEAETLAEEEKEINSER
jgi:hypothetical protein